MPYMREHNGVHYAIQHTYAVPDDAWYIELSESQAPPPGDREGDWSPDATSTGPPFLTAIVPDEDPSREPTVAIHGDRDVPYTVLCWFMEYVVAEIDRAKLAMAHAENETETEPI
jgi:hypothetical protein